MLMPSQYAPVPRSTEFVSFLNSFSTLSCDDPGCCIRILYGRFFSLRME